MSNLLIKDGRLNTRYLKVTGEGTDEDPFVIGTSPNPVRKGFVLHRDITILGVNTPVTPTIADVATGGSLAANTSYKVAVAAKSPYYWSAASAVATLTTANDGNATHVVRVTLAQVPNATSYMVFMSTAAAPTFLAEVTETQRAAGGCRITAMGTVDNAGANAAGTVDVLAVGTGQATNAAPFQLGNSFAYTLGGITPIDCTGYSKAKIAIEVNPTDLRAVPACNVFVGERNPVSGDFFPVVSCSTTALFATSTTGRATLGATTGPVTEFWVAGSEALIVALHQTTGFSVNYKVYVDLFN